MHSGPLKFSLIVATKGRTLQLRRLLESLEAQSYRNFEVIVVDQNPAGFLADTLAPFKAGLPISHLCSATGLSLARNAGLAHVTGEAIAFPDDDCWYGPEVLERVAALLAENAGCDGMTFRLVDQVDPGGYAWFDQVSGPVDLKSVWHRAISSTMFLRSGMVRSIGLFNEDLGLGTWTGMESAEESDYLIRALQRGFHLQYCASTCIYHRAAGARYPPQRAARAYADGLSFGHVLRTYDYAWPFVLCTWIRALGGFAQALLQANGPKARYYWMMFKGRTQGWWATSTHLSATAAVRSRRTPSINTHSVASINPVESAMRRM